MDLLEGRRLVIFGCGYIGSAVARTAAARGAKVTALTRNLENGAALRAEGIAVVVGDLAGEEWHAQIPGKADFVLNCVSSGGGGLDGYRRSYVDGMASVIAWARRQGPAGTMVYTGSTSVYSQGGGVAVDESTLTHGGGERAELLLQAEDLLRAAEGARRRWFVLRLAGIYGPGRHHVLDQVRAGEVAGVGGNRLNLAHRDDIVSAIVMCLTAPAELASDIFNVADDDPAPKRDVVAWLATTMGLPAPRFTGEASTMGRAVTPDRIILNAKLKVRLGWRPTYPTFREGYASFLSR